MGTVPRKQTQLTPSQRRELQRLSAKIEAADDKAAQARADLNDFLDDPDVSIPAAARELGLTPQALYERVRRSK